MKKSSQKKSIMSKYSDTISSKRIVSADKPKIVDYQPRYQGTNLSKDITAPKPSQTLEEKISSREGKPVESSVRPQQDNSKVSVEIAGTKYLIGCTDDMSEGRIRKVAEMANKLLSDNKEEYPGLTNSKLTMLTLLEACDKIITLTDEKNNLRTDLMYYQQQDLISKNSHPVDPTPMEILVQEKLESDEN